MNTSAFSSISFPFLGLEINPPRGFTLGSLDIRFYGIIIAVGLLLAVTLASCAKPKTETSVYYYDILKSPAK